MMLTEVIRQNKEFQLCYHKGQSIGTQYVVIYARRNHLPVNRLGITTGKKVGNAVCRSRARRLIRQAWRENEINAPLGLDIVIVARNKLLELKSTELSEYFQKQAIPALHRIYSGEQQNIRSRREKK
ncbi:MAG: ribonuclease P protein component [Ruminococcus sp.]|jgi:ribonuclease P protein component|nr:ribonuclease P protein component [Ruminococcus sp.]